MACRSDRTGNFRLQREKCRCGVCYPPSMMARRRAMRETSATSAEYDCATASSAARVWFTHATCAMRHLGFVCVFYIPLAGRIHCVKCFCKFRYIHEARCEEDTGSIDPSLFCRTNNSAFDYMHHEIACVCHHLRHASCPPAAAPGEMTEKRQEWLSSGPLYVERGGIICGWTADSPIYRKKESCQFAYSSRIFHATPPPPPPHLTLHLPHPSHLLFPARFSTSLPTRIKSYLPYYIDPAQHEHREQRRADLHRAGRKG